MQSGPHHFTPSVTPKPQKPSANGRSGRSFTVATSPSTVNPSSWRGDKYSSNEVRVPERATPSTVVPPTFRKKKLVLSGDIRNLGTNFALATQQVHLPLDVIITAFDRYHVAVSREEANALLHEYEENNDSNLEYSEFLDDIVRMLRQTALNRSGFGRDRIKKTRLGKHVEKLSTIHSHLKEQVDEVLGANLRVSWSKVKEALQQADPARKGWLSQAVFKDVMTSLEVHLSDDLIQNLAFEQPAKASGSSQEDIDYNQFLSYYGGPFLTADTNSVAQSLIFDRATGKRDTQAILSNDTFSSPGVTSTLTQKGSNPRKVSLKTHREPVAAPVSEDENIERVRVILSDKIASRYSDVNKAFMGLDKDGNGLISYGELVEVLENYNITMTPEEMQALMSILDYSGDGYIDYHEFFSHFGDALKPSAVVAVQRDLQENASLIFAGDKTIRGAYKNRNALSTPGNELKEAMSRLTDDSWRAIYVELSLGDSRHAGIVASAELVRVLSKYLGDLPNDHFNSLYRSCGSKTRHLMDYKALIRNYRPHVLDTTEYFQKDQHALVERAYAKSPTESLVMNWTIRVIRAQMTSEQWKAMKDAIWSADIRRQGRIVSTEFEAIVKKHMGLQENQASFLSFFYEDRSTAFDQILVRYDSFITDFEDPGLESADAASVKDDAARTPRVSRKGAVLPPYALVKSDKVAKPVKKEDEAIAWVRTLIQSHIQQLEKLLEEADSEGRGCIALESFHELCKRLKKGSWSYSTAASTVLGKYIANKLFYYRGFLLDYDSQAGLQTQGLVMQDDDDEEVESAVDEFAEEDDDNELVVYLDLHQAKEALRFLLSTSKSRQATVYKSFQRMDPARHGLLTLPEIRRVLERVEVFVQEATARELLQTYEQEDDDGNKLGRYKYLQMLHAHGGRDPDKLDGMSDISSNCSYYSAITISPRPVMRSQAKKAGPQSLVRKEYAVAAAAIANAIEKPRAYRYAASSGTCESIETLLQQQLQKIGKNRWKELSKAFQRIDKDRTGSISVAGFQKVLDELGLSLSAEAMVKLQLKYDVQQNGRLSYHELLHQLTSEIRRGKGATSEKVEGLLPVLENPSSPRDLSSRKNERMKTMKRGDISSVVKNSIQAKWKQIYSSLKAVDKEKKGRLSAAHFRQMLQWYSIQLSDDDFLDILRQFESSDDELVDYNRFMRACLT